jgi:uncharacterized protein
MEVTFDPAKNASNVRDRNLTFTLVEQLDWASAVVEEDTRKAYGERRFRVLGFIGERLHAVVFTPGFLGSEPKFAEPSALPKGAALCTAAKLVSDPNNPKANPREVKKYAETSKS